MCVADRMVFERRGVREEIRKLLQKQLGGLTGDYLLVLG